MTAARRYQRRPASPAAAPAAPPPQETVEEIDDIDQRSDEWFALHKGVPTASHFGTIMAEGKDGGPSLTRARLLDRMAAHVIDGIPAETYSNAAMQDGIEQEPAIISRYAFERGVEVRSVAFVRRTIPNPLGEDLVIGCSPDGLIGDDGMIETKRMQPDLLVRLIDSGRFPMEHRWQCHGQLWAAGRQWCDLRIGYAGDPRRDIPGSNLVATFRIMRDESVIADMRREVERFSYELRQLVARVKLKAGLK